MYFASNQVQSTGSKWLQLAPNGSKLLRQMAMAMVQHYPKSSQIVLNRPKLSTMIQHSPKWLNMIPDCPKCS